MVNYVVVNFIEQPLPEEGPFPNAGAGGTNGQPGALGLGQRASTGLTLFNSFWSYTTPIIGECPRLRKELLVCTCLQTYCIGGYIADTYWGRYKTINVAIGVATFGHIIIIIAAIPAVIQNPNGYAWLTRYLTINC